MPQTAPRSPPPPPAARPPPDQAVRPAMAHLVVIHRSSRTAAEIAAPGIYGRSMSPRKLLVRLRSGEHQNVRFRDLQRLVLACGFRLARTNGSHHIYAHTSSPAILNLQDVRGVAKPYQIRQFLDILDRYDLGTEEGR